MIILTQIFEVIILIYIGDFYMKLKLNFLFVCLTVMFLSAKGQELDSVSMHFENGKVVVEYDFTEGEQDQPYELYLYGSHDNFKSPLQLTTGDVGKNIYPGSHKVIYWDAQKELGVFQGQISLKVKGSKYVPFVNFNPLEDKLKIVRGTSFNIQWEPMNKDKKVLVKILKNDVPVSTPKIIDNTGHYTWQVPKKSKPGNGYRVQILNTNNLLKEEKSNEFAVRRKIPMAIKIVPAALLLGAGILLLGHQDDSGIPNPPPAPSNL